MTLAVSRPQPGIQVCIGQPPQVGLRLCLLMDGDAKPRVNGKKRVCLRLDDGSVIEENVNGSVEILKVERAFQLGRVSEADVQRLESLLDHARTLLPHGYALPARVNPEADGPVAKRQRTSPVHAIPNGSAYPPDSVDFYPACRKALAEVFRDLEKRKVKEMFYLPVDRNVEKSYYVVIQQPMFLRDIETRLENEEYSSPQDFYEEVSQVWKNCKIFNPPQHWLHKLARSLEDRWEQTWAASGLASDTHRARRTTAGVAANKFDPANFEHAAPSKTRSSKGGQKGDKRPKDELGRSKSHEVTSLGGPRPVPSQLITQLAADIEALQEREMDNELSATVDLLNPEAKQTNTEGEMELDLSSLNYEAAVRVDGYLAGVLGRPPFVPSAGGGHAEYSSVPGGPATDQYMQPAPGSHGGRHGGGVIADQSSSSDDDGDDGSEDYMSD